MMSSRLPDRLLIVAGTYDGVVCGFDSQPRACVNNDDANNNSGQGVMDLLNKAKRDKEEEDSYLKMSFAMSVHDGSVRCLSVASNNNINQNSSNSPMAPSQKKRKQNKTSHSKEDEVEMPGLLFTAGYDDSLAIFNLKKYEQAGELKSPADLGSPTCSAFAPPSSPSYVLMGMTCGKIILYKKRDWSVQHILSGHGGGVNCIAVHPSGKMALSGGTKDGKLMLWDLMRGRLAFVHKTTPPIKNNSTGNKSYSKSTIQDIIWSKDGNRYAFCTNDGKITARDVNTGDDLLDIALPKRSRANQITFIGGDDGLFLAAACDDGSLPVFMVGCLSEEEEKEGAIRATMAIEPVEGAVAREERFKCIQSVNSETGFLVVTSNSGGVCSLIDLEGAARMMLSDDDGDNQEQNDKNKNPDSEFNSDYEEDDDEEELAAEILSSVRIGTGARITAIDVWSSYTENNEDVNAMNVSIAEKDEEPETIDVKEKVHEPDDEEEVAIKDDEDHGKKYGKRKRQKDTVLVGPKGNMIEMDAKEVQKARMLISQAKKRQKRKQKKKKSKE